MSDTFPPKYLALNSQLSKNLAVVMQIEGVPTLYGIATTYTKIRYGDFGLVFGLPGAVYGGLRSLTNLKPYIMLDTSMVIQQRIEPESGKGSIGTITISLIDYNGEISNLITPGMVVDEIMGGKQVKLWIGFTQSSFPEDFLLLYSGYITQLTCPPGKVMFQVSDCTTKSRQPIFATTTSETILPVDAIQTLIPVGNTGSFFAQIQGPDGTYDPTVQTYLHIDDEYMDYGPTGIGNYNLISGTTLTGITGGSTDVSSYLSGQTPSTSLATPGVQVASPQNYIPITDGSGNFYVDSENTTVYGRLTYSGGTWTLTYYSNYGGDETPYTFVSSVSIQWYFTVSGTPNTGTNPISQVVFVARGGSTSLGSTPASHDSDASVTSGVGFGQNTEGSNVILTALKILLSGWDGPCNSGINVLTLGYTFLLDGPVADLFDSTAMVLNQTDALNDLGLTIGDWFYITGATNSGNNISGQITGFGVLNDLTTIIYTNQTFTLENPSTAQVAFRSQYDVYPLVAGVGCRTQDVDVSTFQLTYKNYFTAGTSNVRLYYEDSIDGVDLLSSDLFLPFGCYNISRYGRISVAITKPPLPGTNQNFLQLDYTNVLEPQNIIVTRATNARGFYNLITYNYDYNLEADDYLSVDQYLDTNSLNLFNQESQLEINAMGLVSELGGSTIAQERSTALLNRYKKGAIIIQLKVNWSVGSLIEVSDIVVLNDDGNLKIMNFETGERNLGVQLFEVIDRSYDITAGAVTLKLMGGLGFDVDSRFGLISPSTILNSGCTSSVIRLTPSYGQTKISDELIKWTPLLGLPVRVHSPDWSVVGDSVLIQVDPVDRTALDLSPPLPFTPEAGYILEIGPYPSDTVKTEQAKLKLLYGHVSPSVPVLTGVSKTEFTISPSLTSLFTVGNTVILRNADYSTETDEIAVTAVNPTSGLITLASSLGFVPDNTYTCEGIGFHDGGAFYRYG